MAAKTLFNESDVKALVARLERIKPDDQPLWGSMTPAKMVAHLVDSVDFALNGPIDAKPETGPPMFIRTLVRLYVPLPKNVKTTRDMLKTTPETDDIDLKPLKALLEQMRTSGQSQFAVHPFFGPLTGEQWARLGWKHMDHHLRQFGV